MKHYQFLVFVLLFGMVIGSLWTIHSTLEAMHEIESENITIQSEQRDAEVSQACYFLNNEETESEFYQCMYN